ncbi:uncharacterized protein LOC144389807 [Gasterosteus aculeatus]
MEVGQTVRVAGPPAPSPSLGATYSVPVRIQGGIHQAMVDSGCTQSMIHQRLVRHGALVEASRYGRSPRPPRDFLPSSCCSAEDHGGCSTCLRNTGRRVRAPVRTRFSTSWTCEPNSTHWVSCHVRICSRPRNVNSGCTTEGPG